MDMTEEKAKRLTADADAAAGTGSALVLNVAIVADQKAPSGTHGKRAYRETMQRVRTKLAAACTKWSADHVLDATASPRPVQLHLIASGTAWFEHIPVALYNEVTRFLTMNADRFAQVPRPLLTVYLPADVLRQDTWQIDTAQWIDGERTVFSDKAHIAQVARLNAQFDDFCARAGVHGVADIVQAHRHGARIQVLPDPFLRRIHSGWADYCLSIKGDGAIEEHWMHQMPALEQ